MIMEHVKITCDSLKAIRFSLLLILALSSFSAMASSRDVQDIDRSTGDMHDSIVDPNEMSLSNRFKVEATLHNYLCEHIRYPSGASLDSIISDIKRNGKSSFYSLSMAILVDSTGQVRSLRVDRSFNEYLSREVIRVFQTLPKFDTAGENSVPANKWLEFDVFFKAYTDSVLQCVKMFMPGVFDHFPSATNASFRGGNAALQKYICDHLTYPPSAIEGRIEGTVIVGFVVDEAGQVRDVEVVRSVDEVLDREAVRIVQSFPKFFPATSWGQAIKTKHTVPIVFKLSDEPKPE